MVYVAISLLMGSYSYFSFPVYAMLGVAESFSDIFSGRFAQIFFQEFILALFVVALAALLYAVISLVWESLLKKDTTDGVLDSAELVSLENSFRGTNIFLILIIVGMLGVYLYQMVPIVVLSFKSGNAKQDFKETGLISEWKTFDGKGVYEFRYPPSLILDEKNWPGRDVFFDPDTGDGFRVKTCKPGATGPEGSYMPPDSTTPLVIDGMSVLLAKKDYGNHVEGFVAFPEIVFGSYYCIEFDAQKEDLAIYEKIVSTFAFRRDLVKAAKEKATSDLEEIKNPSKWVTYVSDSGKFQLQVPPKWLALIKVGTVTTGDLKPVEYDYSISGELPEADSPGYSIRITECLSFDFRCGEITNIGMEADGSVVPGAGGYDNPVILKTKNATFTRYQSESSKSGEFTYFPKGAADLKYFFRVRASSEQLPLFEEILKTFQLI